jgi:hypothetical protein
LKVKSFDEFIVEGTKGPTNAGTIMKTNDVTKVQYSVNFADESLEGLRRKLIDKYYPTTDDEEKRHTINRCLSTIVYCFDKKLRVDEDVIETLAQCIGKTLKETMKEIEEEANKYYGGGPNLYGMKG